MSGKICAAMAIVILQKGVLGVTVITALMDTIRTLFVNIVER